MFAVHAAAHYEKRERFNPSIDSYHEFVETHSWPLSFMLCYDVSY